MNHILPVAVTIWIFIEWTLLDMTIFIDTLQLKQFHIYFKWWLLYQKCKCLLIDIKMISKGYFTDQLCLTLKKNFLTNRQYNLFYLLQNLTRWWINTEFHNTSFLREDMVLKAQHFAFISMVCSCIICTFAHHSVISNNFKEFKKNHSVISKN